MFSATWLSSEDVEYNVFTVKGAVVLIDVIHKAVYMFRAYGRC